MLDLYTTTLWCSEGVAINKKYTQTIVVSKIRLKLEIHLSQKEKGK
jgi:hypothetical protein